MDDIKGMLKQWGEHGAQPFHGKERCDQVEGALDTTIRTAIAMTSSAIPELEGHRIGFEWDSDNQISVAVDDDVAVDMFVVEV